MNAAVELSGDVGRKPACEALEVPRATFYRHLGREGRPQATDGLRSRPPLALTQVERGDLTVGFEIRRLSQVMRRVDAIANRLAFSVIVAALIIGSGLIIQAGVDSLIWRIPLVGWGIPLAQITFLAAGILGAWLLISMLRSKGL